MSQKKANFANSKGLETASFKKKIKILVHLGMGGHTSQILRLVDSLGEKYEYSYLLGHDDTTSISKIKFKGKTFVAKNPRLMSDKRIFKVAINMIPASFQLFKILRTAKPNIVLSSGPSLAIPLFWIAKCLRIKTIFLESWVRVKSGSATGKLVYPVTSLFLVQWEKMKDVYKKAVFAGRLS